MSDTWVTTPFSSLISEGHLGIGDGYRAKLDELGGDGPIFLRAGAISERGFDWTSSERFRKDVVEKLTYKLGRPGDTVVTTKGNSVGRTAFVPDNSPEFVYSPHLSYWRSLNKRKVSPQFLRYWSRSAEFQHQLRALAHGTDMAPYLSLSDQRRLTMTLPSIATQAAIGAVLGALDDKIAVNDRLAAVTAELSVLLMARNGTTAGTTTGSVCRIHKAMVQPSAYGNGKVVHFSLPAFDNGEMPELVDASTIRSAKMLLTEPVVLVSKLNPATPRIWRVTPQQEQVCLASPEFLALAPESGVDTATLWAALMQPSFLNSMAAASDGTSKSHQRARPADVLNIEIIDPREVSSALRRQLNSLLERTDRSRQESATLAELRDALLPKLMSGELRVREAERVVSDAV